MHFENANTTIITSIIIIISVSGRIAFVLWRVYYINIFSILYCNTRRHRLAIYGII